MCVCRGCVCGCCVCVVAVCVCVCGVCSGCVLGSGPEARVQAPLRLFSI